MGPNQTNMEIMGPATHSSMYVTHNDAPRMKTFLLASSLMEIRWVRLSYRLQQDSALVEQNRSEVINNLEHLYKVSQK